MKNEAQIPEGARNRQVLAIHIPRACCRAMQDLNFCFTCTDRQAHTTVLFGSIVSTGLRSVKTSNSILANKGLVLCPYKLGHYARAFSNQPRKCSPNITQSRAFQKPKLTNNKQQQYLLQDTMAGRPRVAQPYHALRISDISDMTAGAASCANCNALACPDKCMTSLTSSTKEASSASSSSLSLLSGRCRETGMTSGGSDLNCLSLAHVDCWSSHLAISEYACTS